MSITRRLLALIAPFWRWIALGILLGFLTIGSSVGLMAMSSYLIARSALVADVYDVTIPITLVRVFATLRAAFRYLERLATHRATFSILAHLRTWFYAAIEPLAPARLQGLRSGDLLARIVGDIETLENFYVRVVTPPVVAALVTALACLMIGSFDAVLGLALLVFLLLTGVALPLIALWLSTHPAGELAAARAELNALLVDQVQGIADLLAFDGEQQHQARVVSAGRRLARLQHDLAMVRGLTNALAVLLTGLAALTVLWLAIPLVTVGRIEGVYLALLPLTAIASFEAVQPLAVALQHLQANRAAGQRLFELIDAPQPADAAQSPAPSDSSIELRNVRFAYGAGEPPALDGVSLRVPPGGRVAIVGPSGSGKSTIVNLLLRFWEATEGQALIGGHDVRAYRAEDVRGLLAVAPQRVHLFNATIRDNLALANPDASDEQIAAACRMAQLADFIDALPQGYQTQVGENGLLLSGGERQRLAIARAILTDAPIVILDEATANLDALTEQRLMESLEPFLRTRTVIIIAHRPAVWQGIDQMVRLESGRVVERMVAGPTT